MEILLICFFLPSAACKRAKLKRPKDCYHSCVFPTEFTDVGDGKFACRRAKIV